MRISFLQIDRDIGSSTRCFFCALTHLCMYWCKRCPLLSGKVSGFFCVVDKHLPIYMVWWSTFQNFWFSRHNKVFATLNYFMFINSVVELIGNADAMMKRYKIIHPNYSPRKSLLQCLFLEKNGKYKECIFSATVHYITKSWKYRNMTCV